MSKELEALERLYKCNDDDYTLGYQQHDYKLLQKALLKTQENEKEIAKYKQLEEDLGCSLDVVFKALQNGANYEDVANRMRLLPVDLHFNLDGDYVLYFSDDEHLLTKNYKKTWWLKENKEE